jgi:hypothetical protein
MKGRSRIAVVIPTVIALLNLCFIGDVSNAARVGESPKSDKGGEVTRQIQSGNTLQGQWSVICQARIYRNGNLLHSSQESGSSLVVGETDSDGSYQLYKFPTGFGEGFPRLRNIGGGRYEGSDTVRGITTVVKQNVDLQNDKIIIRQTTVDAPSNQTESDITCTGTRVQSTQAVTKHDQPGEACRVTNQDTHLDDKRFARQYKSVRPFSDGLAAVAANSGGGQSLKWGFIDERGRVVIPIIYDVVTSFNGGLAVVGKFYGPGRNIKWGVVEKLGPQVTPHVNYDAVKILGEGFAAVGYAVSGSKTLKWNLINRENTTILYGFDDFGCFFEGRARASFTDGNVLRRGYVNKVGAFIADEK